MTSSTSSGSTILLLLSSACWVATLACDPSGTKFGYVGSIGPDRWGSLSPNFTTCARGTKQSPIDISTDEAVYNPAMEPLHRNYTAVNASLVDNVFNIMVGVAAVRRRRWVHGRRREAVQAEADALALPLRAHHQRPQVPRGAPYGSRQRRRQHQRPGDVLPIRQAGPFPLADPGPAGRALRRGLRRRARRPGGRRSRRPALAEAARPHVLQVRRVADHAAVHRGRRLEHPCSGEGDDDGSGGRPGGAPGGRVQAQLPADAADQRAQRGTLPPVPEGERGAVDVCAEPDREALKMDRAIRVVPGSNLGSGALKLVSRSFRFWSLD